MDAMATQALITWNAPTHLYTEKTSDWYWTRRHHHRRPRRGGIHIRRGAHGIFIIVAAAALVLHASRPPHIVECEVNDRGRRL